MATLKFKHEDKNYTVKGEWDKNTFTAQAFQGKKEASTVFSMEKTKVNDGELAADDALANAVMEAAKDDVINGGNES
ncbi:MAG: hypothetical protein L3J65_11370 [Robiginitomaculum sp.]|nr:hypothetical protein [Robiginitomaculum sp.]